MQEESMKYNVKQRVLLAPVRIHPDKKAALEKIAERRRESLSEIVREAIDKLIEKDGGEK
jgi:predicted transcriptional regulator